MTIKLNLDLIRHEVVRICFPSLKSADGVHVKVLAEVTKAYLSGGKLNGYEIAKRIDNYSRSMVYQTINELKNNGYIAVVGKRRSRRSKSETDLYGSTLLGFVAYMTLVDYDLGIFNKYLNDEDKYILICISMPGECSLAKELVQKMLVDDGLKDLWNLVMLNSILLFPNLESEYRLLMESEQYLDEESEKISIEFLKKHGIVEYEKGWRAEIFINFIYKLLLINPARVLILLPYIYKHKYLKDHQIDYTLLQDLLPLLVVFDMIAIIYRFDQSAVAKSIKHLIKKLKEDQDLMNIYFKYIEQLSLMLERAASDIKSLAKDRILDIEELMYIY